MFDIIDSSENYKARAEASVKHLRRALSSNLMCGYHGAEYPLPTRRANFLGRLDASRFQLAIDLDVAEAVDMKLLDIGQHFGD